MEDKTIEDKIKYIDDWLDVMANFKRLSEPLSEMGLMNKSSADEYNQAETKLKEARLSLVNSSDINGYTDNTIHSIPANANPYSKSSYYANLTSMLISFERFRSTVCFPTLMYLNTDQLSLDVVRTKLTGLRANATSAQSLEETIGIVNSLVNYDIENFGITTSQYLFSNSDSLFSTMTSSYSKYMQAIGPQATVPNDYALNMMALCIEQFIMVNNTFQTKLQSTDLIQRIEGTSMTASLSSLCSHIITNVTFSPEETFDEFADHVNKLVHDSTNMYVTDPIRRQLFMISFMPYFALQYIINFIAQSTLSGKGKAPQNAYVRRFAILCVYIFHYYIIFSAYNASIKYDPAGTHSIKLRLILDNIITNILNQEDAAMDFMNQFRKSHQTTKKSFDLTKRIYETNRQIESIRNKLSTVLANEATLTPQYKKAMMLKWMWLSFLSIYITFFIVIMIIPFPEQYSKLKYSIIYGVGGLLLLGLTISGIVYVARNY